MAASNLDKGISSIEKFLAMPVHLHSDINETNIAFG